MKVYIGTDHRGYDLKQALKEKLTGYEVIDMGAMESTPGDDFVDYATLVAQKVASDTSSRGLLMCGSGAGMCIAANKTPGIRCAVGHNVAEVEAARHDDDINILALPADFIVPDEAEKLVSAFLSTEFVPEERYVRRIAKFKELETHA